MNSTTYCLRSSRVSRTAPPIYLFAGEGDDFTVRRWWQNLFGPRLYRAPERPEARPPFDFGLRPDPLVVHGRQARAKLVVDSIGRLEFGGSLRVSAPDGIRTTPNRAEFTKVKEDRAFSRSVALSRRSSLAEGGYFVTCAAEIDRIIYRERNTVIALGDPAASVAVTRTGERGELHRVDNGLLALTVAPEFQGSAISLERGGEQLLRSAYPEARPLAWMNPWFGGIEPFLGCVGRDLFQEKFTARTITRRGSQGITWQGVRVRCAPKQERGRKEALQVDYLLAPGSSILAVAIRTTRRAGTAGWIQAGIALWPVLGGSHLDAVISSADDPRASRLRCDFGGGLGSRRWVIAETRKSGQGVLLAASPSPVRANWVGGQVFGADGYALQASRAAMVEAGQTAESVYFLCFADGERARDLAEGLSKLKELP